MKTAAPASPTRPLPRALYRLLIALGCALATLLLLSSHWQANASLEALEDLRRQGERVEHLNSLLIQVIDAENAVRGYLLSGNRRHLDPFEQGVGATRETLEVIRSDLASVPFKAAADDAIAALAGLVAIKFKSLEQAVQSGTPGADARIEGKRYTDRIRDVVFGLKARIADEAQSSFARSTTNFRWTRWAVVGLVAVALTLMGILLLSNERQVQLRDQIARMLRSENERLDNLVLARTAELSDLASYLTDAREAEKERLARELHDELGALLTAAKMEAGWIASHMDDAGRGAYGERLVRLTELLSQGIAMKRRIIDGLRPAFLEELGLVAALRTLGEEFARGGDEVLNLDVPVADVETSAARALALYRIAQEALTNIRKHAHARHVTLAFRVHGECLELEVADDGAGFRAGASRAHQHGLGGMKHRVQMCAGEFRIDTRPGGGTKITVAIPRVAPQEMAA